MGASTTGGWTDHKILMLTDLCEVRPKLSYGQIAKRMGVSRSTVAGGIRRFIHGVIDERKDRGKYKPNPGQLSRNWKHPVRWTDAVLTEKWEQRKMRRQEERSRDHA